jgi:hypothetical protein
MVLHFACGLFVINGGGPTTKGLVVSVRKVMWSRDKLVSLYPRGVVQLISAQLLLREVQGSTPMASGTCNVVRACFEKKRCCMRSLRLAKREVQMADAGVKSCVG